MIDSKPSTDTFEDFVTRNKIDRNDPAFKGIKSHYERGQLVEELHRRWEIIPPPSPEWCADAATGHDYDTADYDEATFLVTQDCTFVRWHVAPSGDSDLCSLVQVEGWHNGEVRRDPVKIVLDGFHDSDEITADEARQQAQALLEAADRLDELTAAL
jgi:hypothetical protein